MYLADTHLHSLVSPDAACSMAELAGTAAEAGLAEICYTDHVEPVAWGGDALREDFDWSPAVEEFARAKAAWGHRLTLGLGAELGDPLRAPEVTDMILSKAPPLDFVIASVHSMSGRWGWKPLFFYDPADETEAREGIADYLTQVRDVARWGRFDVLGHLTLPLRYLNEDRGLHASFDGFEDLVEEIFRLVIQGGRGIELNTNRGGTPLPDERWLRLYRDLGGEIITLGSDAHDAASLGRGIAPGQELLRKCGFSRFCTFKGRNPVWHQL